jgi:hypothetical protein
MLLMLFVYLPAMAQDAPEARQKRESRLRREASDQPSAPAAAVVVTGGPVTKVTAVTNLTPQTTKSFNFVAVTGAARVVSVPAGGDTVVITFTAECELFPSNNDDQEWVEVEIRDGTTVLTGGDLAFCGGQDYSLNSVQVVKRLAAGSHTIRVFFKTTDTTREAWLDDWSLTILQSD